MVRVEQPCRVKFMRDTLHCSLLIIRSHAIHKCYNTELLLLVAVGGGKSMRPSYFLQYFMRQPKSFVLSIHIFPSHLPNVKEEGWHYFLQLDFHHTPIKPDGKWPIHRRKDPIFGLASGLISFRPLQERAYSNFFAGFQFDLETVDEEPRCGCADEIPIYFILFYFIYLFQFV